MIYGVVIIILAACSCIHLIPSRCQSRISSANEPDEEENDGTLYELMSKDRKNRMDESRGVIIREILEKYSLTLGEEHMLRKEGGSSDIEEGFDNEHEDGYTHIYIPRPGMTNENVATSKSNVLREVPRFCPICLSEFEINETICWSQNAECTHFYHEECLVQWLVSLGKRRSKMKRFPADKMPVKRLLNYEMECPSCRQGFLTPQESKSDVIRV